VARARGCVDRLQAEVGAYADERAAMQGRRLEQMMARFTISRRSG
jgi:hypothetical protein